MANTKKNVTETTNDNNEIAKTKIVPKDIDPNQIITVCNGFQGRLIYVSPRTKETFRWDSFGDTQEIELRELRNAKSSAKNFFINNWFMFDEEYQWVIDYLGLNQYYKNALSLSDFDDLFTKTPSEISKITSKLSDGQKKSVAYRARQLVIEGELTLSKLLMLLKNHLASI